jgi:phage I-like protein
LTRLAKPETLFETMLGSGTHRLDKVTLEREPPSRFRLFRKGVNHTAKGDFIFDATAAKAVMAAWQDAGNELAIDYEHQTAADPPIEAPAAGWFTPEVIDGELWATNVRWTTRAEEYLRSGEYRYTSPYFRTDKTGRVIELLNTAITNLPATKHLDALVAAKATQTTKGTPTMKLSDEMKTQVEATVKALSAMLAGDYVAPDGGENECPMMKHLSSFLSGDGKAGETATNTEVAAKLTALTGKNTVGEAVVVLSAWKAASGEAGAMAVRLKALEDASAGVEFERLIDEGKRAGKLTPHLLGSKLVGDMRARAAGDGCIQLKTLIEAMPALNVQTTEQPATPVSGTLTDEDKRIALSQGIDLKDLEAHKLRRANEKGAR